MTRVLMVGSAPSVKGGITSVISQLLKHDWKKENVIMDFVPTYIKANFMLMLIFYIKSVLTILLKILFNRPDIVYIHMSYKGSFSRKYLIHRLCKLFGLKDIVHLHGSEFEKWYNSCGQSKKEKIKRLLRECDKMFVLGEEWNTRVLNIEKNTDTAVIKNTVAIPENSVKWNEKNFKVLFLGVLIKRKGVSDLLDTVSALKRDERIGNLHFVIAGSGEEEQNLKRKTKELNIEQEVEFVGWIDNEKKMTLLKECQAMVLPSYNEGLPVAVLEAISYGMPVIATDVGDMKAAVKNEYNGFIVEPGDCESLADSLFKLNDEDTFRKMSNNSSTLAKEEFSDQMYFHKLAKIFNDLNI
ncbi:MAG: glycosyltransferase family 4 protein [Clostridia bacterium]|nr:glycosyltransferase family 4 protein [Clostridia bacterium]